MARIARTTPVTPKAPKNEVRVSEFSQSLVTFTAKRGASLRLSGTTAHAMGSAAKLGWQAAAATSEARRAKLLSVAEKELAAYLLQ
jgi:hypothetical protein